MIRYRTGLHGETGALLVGQAHLRQSVAKIWTTQLTEVVMLLDFGAELASHIGRNMVPPVVLAIYRDAVKAVHRWEPEYRVRRCSLVAAERTGTLSLATSGLYYPEGRFGNYALSEPAEVVSPLVAAESAGRRAASVAA